LSVSQTKRRKSAKRIFVDLRPFSLVWDILSLLIEIILNFHSCEFYHFLHRPRYDILAIFVVSKGTFGSMTFPETA